MTRHLIFIAAAAAGLQAQTAHFQQNGWVRFSDWTAVPSHVSGPMGQSGPVAGKPFSGTEARQTTQVLADGTNLKHSETSTFYRDGQGRMRSESPSHVMIYDPVAGVTLTLDTLHKRYQKATAMGEVSIAAVGNRTSVSSHTVGTSPHPALAPAESKSPEAPAVTEDLPPQTINGVFAKGTRITSTIPAGTFGNDRDVKIVNERWYSDDLQVLVRSSNSDPRFGTTTYELTNIVQAPPDPALFQAPADYTPSLYWQTFPHATGKQ